MAEKQIEKKIEKRSEKQSNALEEIKAHKTLEEQDSLELKIEILREDIERLKAELQLIKQGNEAETSAITFQDFVTEAPKVVERIVPLPDWVDKPWMYVKPENPKFLESWRRDWSDYTLKWAKFLVIHLISVAELMEKRPFDKLSEVALRDILEYMNSKNSVKWWDKNKTLVRIYWRSLEEWCEIIYRWALRTGRLDFTLFEIMDEKEDFSTLPPEDIKEIFRLMVEKRFAEWMGKKREMIKINY
ncbi:MAG: hypothetical protein QW261_02395 [Candidatus Jordarchaeaceae archaeon]